MDLIVSFLPMDAILVNLEIIKKFDHVYKIRLNCNKTEIISRLYAETISISTALVSYNPISLLAFNF